MKKKFFNKNITGLSIVCIFLLKVTLCFSAETVLIGVNEYAPLISKNMAYNGSVGHILTDIFALEGIKVKYEWVPWKRAYISVKNGKYDLTPCWSKNEEREKEVLFSEPLYQMYHVFFHLKSNPLQWQSYDDLKGFRIGATIGYFYGYDFKKAEKDGKIIVDYAPSDALNFKKLVAGRFPLFVANYITGYTIAQKSLTSEDFFKITHNTKTVSTPSNHHVLFAKTAKGTRLCQLFNKGLKQLKENGLFDQYLENLNNMKQTSEALKQME
jgi:polar amino acid transport system substrate-binding protein